MTEIKKVFIETLSGDMYSYFPGHPVSLKTWIEEFPFPVKEIAVLYSSGERQLFDTKKEAMAVL